MKTIKIIKAVMTISILSIMIGCGDQIISTDSSISLTEMQSGGRLTASIFKTQLKLTPGVIYTFNESNTGLSEFNEISILNHSQCNDDIEITAYFRDEAVSLDCNTSDIRAKILMFENLTSGEIELEIALTKY